ncbi:D-sedoheptulose 7-phosphate isomerase [Methylobacterium sp. BE186]|uniref:D-sedoheptulose 7-phosphate isomerase n=1 Tax=Methylobacterium sp. BE186 TaxID=2817715 RepID=UPI00286449A9|nr:D-sedoheptulose 7-phosphate isomerase [Methylobacterium sp. BE186]MDR7035674.1 D-sedoheptulose 7-phosphate isomerase [Methylobacterium sp. BE186]
MASAPRELTGSLPASGPRRQAMDAHLAASVRVMQEAASSHAFLDSLAATADLMVACLRGGGKLMFAGNGGSAADAQHIAGEFVSRLNLDRAPLAALALTVDTSVLTAIGNDYGFERVFERQVRGLGRPGDMLVGISTSGRSPNVLRAVEAANAGGIRTVAFCGEGETELGRLCAITVAAPSRSTPLIQQVHIAAAHVICGLVEQAMFGSPA